LEKRCRDTLFHCYQVYEMRSLLVSFFSLCLISATSATAAQVEFSAEVIQSVPQQEPQQGRIDVGNDQVRTEMSSGGRTMIQIIDMKHQVAYMLDPAQKTYMERKAGPGEMIPGGGAPPTAANPCAGMQNLSCTKVGVETVNARPTEKWVLENTSRGQSGKMTVWFDQVRHTPIREILPDGSSMEMRLVGKDTVNGRATEKWEIKAMRPGGQSSVAYQWFDPELNTNIRVEQAGGFVYELRDIKIGKQPADLFVVPPGYKLTSMPQGDGAGPPGGGN
jgi:hypothetical protein